MAEITFSVKPMTLKDWALVGQVKNNDMAALMTLIARRSDPPVSEDVVGELTDMDLPAVTERLAASIKSVGNLNAMISDALGKP